MSGGHPMRCIKFIWRLTSLEDSQLCNKESSTSKNTYSVVLFITYPDLKSATCLIYPRFIHNNHVCLYDFFGKFYQGIARTQSPTNKNDALELPTFGVIVGVSPTEVQWRGLALEEPPSWSRLTSVPGKYEEGWGGYASYSVLLCCAFVRLWYCGE